MAYDYDKLPLSKFLPRRIPGRFTQKLADYIRGERERQGLTVDEVVQRMGCYKNINKGRGRVLDIEEASGYAVEGSCRLVAKVLGLDPDYVVGLLEEARQAYYDSLSPYEVWYIRHCRSPKGHPSRRTDHLTAQQAYPTNEAIEEAHKKRVAWEEKQELKAAHREEAERRRQAKIAKAVPPATTTVP
jgi:transcriptional regulator with XRE-family HTH domain